MLNIVIPMAGAGSRFREKGFVVPKPLIPVNGVPMIRVVINNLTPHQEHRFIFICQRAHVSEYSLRDRLQRWAPGSEVVEIEGITEGAACTVLRAEHLIDSSAALMIANSDQYIDSSIDAYVEAMDARALDGLIMTMSADDPKWSYVALNQDGLATEVAEKRVISTHATVGIYNFARGSDFVRAAKEMIAKDLRVNNEFYVAPTYNELIARGDRIGAYNIGREAQGMYGLGIPADLELFLSLDVHKRATAVGV